MSGPNLVPSQHPLGHCSHLHDWKMGHVHSCAPTYRKGKDKEIPRQEKPLFFFTKGASKVHLSPHPCPIASNLITYPYQATREDMKCGLQQGSHTCWFFTDMWLFTFKDHSRFHLSLSTHFSFFCVLVQIHDRMIEVVVYSFSDREDFRRSLTNSTSCPRHLRAYLESFDKQTCWISFW